MHSPTPSTRTLSGPAFAASFSCTAEMPLVASQIGQSGFVKDALQDSSFPKKTDTSRSASLVHFTTARQLVGGSVEDIATFEIVASDTARGLSAEMNPTASASI